MVDTEGESQDSLETPAKSFTFVMNVRELVGGEELIVVPGHTLRRATPDEIDRLKRVLFGMGPMDVLLDHLPPWEGTVPATGAVRSVPPEEWRYFVIEFTGSNQVVLDLQVAFDLMPVELELGPSLFWYGVAASPGRMFHTLGGRVRSIDFFVEVTPEYLRDAADLYSRLCKSDDDLMNVKRLARQLGSLKALPHDSPLRFLGYFGLLEALLTHKPKPSDPYESITRQVKMKLALLDNRWDPRLDYSPFGGAKAETIWSKMYGYRSQIAHGGGPALGSDLSILGTPAAALGLVKEAVKSVLRLALVEPQLVADLREC